MKPQQRIEKIVKWIRDYCKKHNIDTLVVGISGGIDSSVVSTLCARTGMPTYVLSMPIKQSKATHSLSQAHGTWLTEQYHNLTPTFKQFEKCFSTNELAGANSRARLRMMTLYHAAQETKGIVVGTGNRVEDFGVGFFTKYGDGGVDISPIGDCMKTDVWAMGECLNIDPAIIAAPPTDGLWADGRTDEDQVGMSYPELETMMHMDEAGSKVAPADRVKMTRYRELRAQNMHKMQPIPVCTFKK